MALWVPMRVVAMSLTGSNQEMESLNKVLKLALQRAPNISLPLLDARLGNRRELQLGSRADNKKKWSDIEGQVNAMIDEALEVLQDAKHEGLDFSPPEPATG
eukprot:9460395-Pyramimonas_sp.AAC.1